MSAARLRLAALSLLLAGPATHSLAAQGLGVSARIGVYRAMATYPGYQDPGIGGDLIGQWGFPSGVVLGVGGRAVGFQNGPRLSAFASAEYAPAPTPVRRIRPIFGGRLGPYVDELDGDPLVGLEAGAMGGVSLGLSRGVSLTLTADVTVVVTTNDYVPIRRRLYPGLMLGVTVH